MKKKIRKTHGIVSLTFKMPLELNKKLTYYCAEQDVFKGSLIVELIENFLKLEEEIAYS